MKRTIVLASLLLALSACGGKPEADAPKAAATAPAAAKQKTVIDDQLKALDKAKAVEQQLEDEKEKHDKDIEAAGG
jgi:hypothetical protein